MSSPQLTYYNLGLNVVAFSTTRLGGCSTGNYAAFNINAYCGDSEEHITANRESLCHLLNIENNCLIMPHQVHGCEIRKIDAPQQEIIEGTDAVMTNVSQLCIGVSTADCIPVLLYDEHNNATCAIHAGWRGTVQRIVQKAITAMADAYGSRPADLKAVVGPGISLLNFEIGDEVYDNFAAAGFDMSAISRRYAKWHIDLPECNRLQLVECGVPETNIQMTGICTYDNYDKYFSARRLGINSGRIYTGILIK